VGASSDPSRVLKGLRMAGRMGNERRTIQNLQVIKVMPEKNIILIKGNVPGSKNSYVLIKK
jgi:large subunit ribosomal protein L3